MEEEQDLMGLYQSELTRQIHLRNKQKREWGVIRKNMKKSNEEKKNELSHQQQLFEQEQERANVEEMQETEKSKGLAAALVKSANANLQSDDTMKKAVDLLQNQNGNMLK